MSFAPTGWTRRRSRQLAGRNDEIGQAARRWVQLTAERKDLLFRCQERGRIAAEITRITVRRRA